MAVDPLAFPRVGPGLSFVSRDGLAIRLKAIGLGDPDMADSLVACLGLGSIVTPDGVELYHWEGLCVRLMEVLGQNQRVYVKPDEGRNQGLVRKAQRISVSDGRWHDSTYSGVTEAALLCVMLDRQFDGVGSGADVRERVLEAERLVREVRDVAARTHFGLARESGPSESGADRGKEPGAAEAERDVQSGGARAGD